MHAPRLGIFESFSDSSQLGACPCVQQGWWKWLSGVIDNSLYAVLFLDYTKSVVPALGGGFGRVISLNVIVFVSRHFSSSFFFLVAHACRGVFATGLLFENGDFEEKWSGFSPVIELPLLTGVALRSLHCFPLSLRELNPRNHLLPELPRRAVVLRASKSLLTPSLKAALSAGYMEAQ